MSLLSRIAGAARDLRADLAADLALVAARHRRAGARFPRASTCADMSAAVLVLLRSSVALRRSLGTACGTRAALRWLFHVDIWTDDIGPGLSLPHPFNIVVGAGVDIGARCTLLHNVTIQHASHTTIGDGAVLGVGTVILADRSIGTGAFCGANSVVTRDVPPHAVVVGAPARVVRTADKTKTEALHA
jgi:serine O-acetyltransferase